MFLKALIVYSTVVSLTTAVTYSSHPKLSLIRAGGDNYQYGYSVQEFNDIKGHEESRVGGITRGRYYLLEPDGLFRVVRYSSHPVLGFNAVVERSPTVHGVRKLHYSTAGSVYSRVGNFVHSY